MWPFPKCGRSREEVESEAESSNQKWAAASDEEIAAHVRALILDEFDDLTPEQMRDDLRFIEFDNSMDYLELLMQCEEDFGLEIPDDDGRLEQIQTVGDFCEFIIERLRTI